MTAYGLLYVSRKSLIVIIWLVLSKPGGLDSRDQSRLRTSLVSRPTFLKCPDFLNGRDQLFFSQSRFLLRLSRRVKICWDAVKICRQIWHCQGLLSLKMMKSLDGLRNLDEKIQKSTHFSRLRQTVEKRQNFLISTNFSFSIETFWSGHWCRDEIEKSQSRSRYLDRRD